MRSRIMPSIFLRRCSRWLLAASIGITTAVVAAGSSAALAVEEETLCQEADAISAPQRVILYCTDTDIAYSWQSHYSGSPDYRDRAQIVMAELALKISLAHKVLGHKGRSAQWFASSKRLLTHVSLHGSNAETRALAAKYLAAFPH